MITGRLWLLESFSKSTLHIKKTKKKDREGFYSPDYGSLGPDRPPDFIQPPAGQTWRLIGKNLGVQIS